MRLLDVIYFYSCSYSCKSLDFYHYELIFVVVAHELERHVIVWKCLPFSLMKTSLLNLLIGPR